MVTSTGDISVTAGSYRVEPVIEAVTMAGQLAAQASNGQRAARFGLPPP
jgi:hypothetical protein